MDISEVKASDWLYIIDPTNFYGAITSHIDPKDNRVCYSGELYRGKGCENMTFNEYKEFKKNPNLIAMEYSEFFEKYYKPYLKTLQGPWKEITADDWMRALECLPPLRWTNTGNHFEFFFLCEADTADLHSCFISSNGKYYSAVRSRYANTEALESDFKAYLDSIKG